MDTKSPQYDPDVELAAIYKQISASKIVRRGGNAFALLDGTLFATAVYRNGKIAHDQWSEVSEMEDDEKEAVLKALAE